jgi:hypothetical protein
MTLLHRTLATQTYQGAETIPLIAQVPVNDESFRVQFQLHRS